MQRYIMLVVMLLSLCISSLAFTAEIPLVKPEDVGLSSEKLILVDEVINGFIEDKRLAGSIVMIARHGKIAHFKTYGQMDIEENKPMRQDAIMAIASMTKAITSVAALILYEEGKIDLDAQISTYIPQLKNLEIMRKGRFMPPKRGPTIRDLMRHTSGWGNGKSGDAKLDKLYKEIMGSLLPEDSLEERIRKLSRLPLAFEPGTDWVYSLSTDVLGLVVEKISGIPLDQFFHERIFGPLDMPDTACYVPEDKMERLATVYQSDSHGTLKAIKLEFLKNKPVLCSGGGGLVSTIRDYMRFLMMISNNGNLHGVHILTKESVDLMRRNDLPEEAGWVTFSSGDVLDGLGFGLGFAVREKSSDQDSTSQIGEYGWHGFYNTHYWLLPKDDLIVITFEQISPFSKMVFYGVKGPIYEAVVD